MIRVFRTIAAAVLLAAVAACSSPSATEQAQSAETAALAPLKAKFSGVVIGFDYSGDTTLVVSLDVQTMYNTMGDYEEQAMKTEALSQWRTVWRAQHPGKHATLHVRFVDFRGTKILEGSIAA